MNYTEEIKKTINILNAGGTILYPTDTIWGLGCDARNEAAIDKVIALKKRPAAKSFVLLLDNENKIQSYVQEVPEIAWSLIEFADSPMTIILPNAKNLAKKLLQLPENFAIHHQVQLLLKQSGFKTPKTIVAVGINKIKEAASNLNVYPMITQT